MAELWLLGSGSPKSFSHQLGSEPRLPFLSNGLEGSRVSSPSGFEAWSGGEGKVGVLEAREPRPLSGEPGRVRLPRGGSRGRWVANLGPRLLLVGAGLWAGELVESDKLSHRASAESGGAATAATEGAPGQQLGAPGTLFSSPSGGTLAVR